MGIIGSKTQVDYYNDTYHITDTFSNHLEWKDTVKRLNRRRYTSFLYEQVNVPERFGSQPYVIYVIYDTETKDAIQKEAYDQPYVTICNCVRVPIFIFVLNFPFLNGMNRPLFVRIFPVYGKLHNQSNYYGLLVKPMWHLDLSLPHAQKNRFRVFQSTHFIVNPSLLYSIFLLI